MTTKTKTTKAKTITFHIAVETTCTNGVPCIYAGETAEEAIHYAKDDGHRDADISVLAVTYTVKGIEVKNTTKVTLK